MFENLRKQAYNNLAMKSAGKIVITGENKSGYNLARSLQEQKQPMYDYFDQINFLDQMEKEIQSLDVNVQIDTTDLEKKLEKLF